MQIKKTASEKIEVPFAALDIGYFSVKGATHRDENKRINTFVFPSIAPIVRNNQSTYTGLSGMKGVNIMVGENNYFVGPDAQLTTGKLQLRNTNENYINTDEYKALFLGGLYHIVEAYRPNLNGVNHITINRLIGGLPLNTIESGKDSVRALMEGEHILPGVLGKEPITVHVKSASIIPQPQGALYSATARRKPEEIADFFSRNLLVLDVGGGTFDWFMINNKKMVAMRSGAHPKGMLTAVKEIVSVLAPKSKDDEFVIKKVEEAIRNNRSTVRVGGIDADLEKQKIHVTNLMHDCLKVMDQSVGGLDAIDGIIFTGGGGKFLMEVAETVYPQYKYMMELDTDPLFSNVCGFFTLGEITHHAQNR